MPTSPVTAVAEIAPEIAPVDPEVAQRVGAAWRELRRGAAMQRLRERIYTVGGETMDLALVDALDHLALHSPARMGELARSLRVDASTATRTVDRLVAAGLAERRPDPTDARVKVVVATRKGRARLERVREQGLEMLVASLGEFNPVEQELLAELLERLVVAVDHFVDDAS
jgi:DNA-binding MarR family transcriptional regulator